MPGLWVKVEPFLGTIKAANSTTFNGAHPTSDALKTFQARTVLQTKKTCRTPTINHQKYFRHQIAGKKIKWIKSKPTRTDTQLLLLLLCLPPCSPSESMVPQRSRWLALCFSPQRENRENHAKAVYCFDIPHYQCKALQRDGNAEILKWIMLCKVLPCWKN